MTTQEKINALEAAINNPATPWDEVNLHKRVLAKIKSTSGNTAPSQPANTTAPTRQRPSPIMVSLPGTSTGSAAPAQAQVQTVSMAATKTVIIDGTEMSEGQVRGALTTALRDLAESKHATNLRWDDLRAYKVYSRAFALYQAMLHFWGQGFSWGNLDAPAPNKNKRYIWGLLVIDNLTQTNIVWQPYARPRDGAKWSATTQIGRYSAECSLGDAGYRIQVLDSEDFLISDPMQLHASLEDATDQARAYITNHARQALGNSIKHY